MIVVSDTNILSSLAAAEALHYLFQLFSKADICIPPSVQRELQIGLDRQQLHLTSVLHAINTEQIHVIALSVQEQQISENLPRQLNRGECEAIALSQHRNVPLLSNDKRAIRYCLDIGIAALDLPAILNLLWTQRTLTKAQIHLLIQKMAVGEQLVLSDAQRQRVFASRPHRK